MSKQVDTKATKPVDTKAKPAPAKAAQPAKTDAKAVAPAKAAPAPVKAAPAPAKVEAKAAPAKAAPAPVKAADDKPQKSAIHLEIDKIVLDATKNYEHKKTTKTEIVHEVKEIKVTGDDKKTYTALVVYLPFVYVKNHRGLLAKLVNDIQAKRKTPAFIVSHRTLINPKDAYKQKIPRNRTLTSVYDSILEDLIAPATIIGKRTRFHLDGSQHLKVFLNDDSKAFLESKLSMIAQIYKQLTNRKVNFEFRHDMSFAKVPLLKIPRAKVAKKGANIGAKKEAAQ